MKQLFLFSILTFLIILNLSAQPTKPPTINSAQTKSNIQKANKKLLPQEIDYDGKPMLEYKMNNKIIALDSYNEADNEGSYLRMKFNNKETILKMQKNGSSKVKRVYSNEEFTVTFYDIIYGACVGGEGLQYLTGKLMVQTRSEQSIFNFNGTDPLYSSKKCQ